MARWILQRTTEEGIVLTYGTSKRWERKSDNAVRFERKIDAESVIDFFPEDVEAVQA